MGYPSNLPGFQPGPRLIDGSDAQGLADLLGSAASGITAYAGGGQANATQLNAAINEVVTVGSAADSVKLPPSFAGARVIVINAHASNAIQVFGYNTATINGVASGTGVSQAAGKTAAYYCPVAGKWYRELSA